MGLKDIGETLPPGFRFYPSDEELVCHYLRKKIANEEASKGTLIEIDLHTCEPWQLPEVAKLNGSEWYFFSFRDRKYATGFRTNRATKAGYWKATGKDRVILDPSTRQAVGMRKTLVFYMNRAPNGLKTSWIMHEFRLEAPHEPPKEDWVLCRVFHKSKEENHNLPLFDTTSTTTSPPSVMVSPPLLPHVQGNAAMVYGYQGTDSIDLNPNPQLQPYTRTQNDPNSAYYSSLLSHNHLTQLYKEEVNPYSSNCSFNFNDVIMVADPDDFRLSLDTMELQGIENGHHLSHHHNFGDQVFGLN